MNLILNLLEVRLVICRLNADVVIPVDMLRSENEFLSITRTADELSIVCPEELAPASAKVQAGWRAFKVAGPLDFSLTGVMATLATPLATAKISLFAVATFDTDYLLVPQADLEGAITALGPVCRIER